MSVVSDRTQVCEISNKKEWHQVRLTKIKNTEISKNITELKRFLGIVQYYRQYINGYADIAGSLYDILKEDGSVVWKQV